MPDVPEIDVRELRRSLEMTQVQFAASYGFDVATLRHWEQKQRRPAGPARTLLILISRAPKMVADALAGAAPVAH